MNHVLLRIFRNGCIAIIMMCSVLILYAQGGCVITHGTLVSVAPNTVLSFHGTLKNEGIFHSRGSTILSGDNDVDILGNFSDASCMGYLIKKNQGNVHLFSHVNCLSVAWERDGPIYVHDSCELVITDTVAPAILMSDTVSRFFVLGNHAGVSRLVYTTDQSYEYPIGYDEGFAAYRGFILEPTSLGTTGPHQVRVSLIPSISGTINYQKYFSSDDSSCVDQSWITFNCLGSDGWHCDGPDDYEYRVKAYVPNDCGGSVNRIIKTASGTHAWQDSIESVVGNFPTSLCTYSDWSGMMTQIPGGVYRSFSDFTVASYLQVLPVTLRYFTAEPRDQKFIALNWKTETEIMNHSFGITRSIDGIHFNRIGVCVGAGTTSQSHDYVFHDYDVVANTLYYYRLEQIDYNQQVRLSEMVAARIDNDESVHVEMINVLGQVIETAPAGVTIMKKTTGSRTVFSQQVTLPH